MKSAVLLGICSVLGGLGYAVTCTWHAPSRALPEVVAEQSRQKETPRLSEIRRPPLPDFADYATEVVPVLRKRCELCHTGVLSWGSPFWSGLDERCATPLSTLDRETIAQWIDSGSFIPKRSIPAEEPEDQHWAFEPFNDVDVPISALENPIDAFLSEKLKGEGLRIEPRASRQRLFRRLSFHVTGLPPSLKQIERWFAHETEIADIVDELLSQPSYGEHMARYWLDLARYADTNGYEDDGQKPFAWKYRDFVIRGWNEDMPFDRFVWAQLAGDLKHAPSEEDHIAVGFLRLGAWDSEPDDALQAHFDQVDEVLTTTCSVFLGMEIGCARCHDHLEEPLTQVDYASLAACFSGLVRPTKGRQEIAIPSATTEQLTVADEMRDEVMRLYRAALNTHSDLQARQFRDEARRLESKIPFDLAYRFQEGSSADRVGYVLFRGQASRPLGMVPAGPPGVFGEKDFSQGAPLRRQLADWIVYGRSPLLARVFVNRVWKWHFGRALVDSLNNFGESAPDPSHPELLEWLSRWFAKEANWSIKKLQRLILTSQAFLSDSSGNDRQRELIGSYTPRPLRAEVVHDSLAFLAGVLSDQLGGSPHPSPFSTKTDSLFRENTVGAADVRRGTASVRRAIYLPVVRNRPEEFLRDFGLPDSAKTCSQRTMDVTSRQALALWNSELAVQCSKHLASRILEESPHEMADRLRYAIRMTLFREPTGPELIRLEDYVNHRTRDGAATPQIFGEICLVLVNLDEWMTLD
ncbi:MAG: DUF1549 domain-containing protein [Planctomycetaceae bacterium]|nr:DUF1549 domain-containing protein [Planctomycetaceae bacterium]